MKNIIILIILLLFTVSQSVFAQRTITGKVINAEDGLPMPGVSVVVKGTTTGMTTDTNGNFMLSVQNNATLQVSFIGFKTVEIPIGYQTLFDITLQTDVNVLGEVVVSENRVIPPERAVVTAMGIVRDKLTLTYSIQSISGAIIAPHATFENPLAGLEGRIAGYYKGQIRGRTSFTLQRGLLYVIDGVPMDSMPPISPEEIEEVVILKSANAAILYGSQAANGAVLITLKK